MSTELRGAAVGWATAIASRGLVLSRLRVLVATLLFLKPTHSPPVTIKAWPSDYACGIICDHPAVSSRIFLWAPDLLRDHSGGDDDDDDDGDGIYNSSDKDDFVSTCFTSG